MLHNVQHQQHRDHKDHPLPLWSNQSMNPPPLRRSDWRKWERGGTAIQGCSEARVGSLLNDEDEDNGEESKHLKDYSAPRVGSFLVAACSVITQRIAHFSIASRGQTWGVQFWVYSVIRIAQCPRISNIMFSFHHVCLIHTWYLSQPSHHITSLVM